MRLLVLGAWMFAASSAGAAPVAGQVDRVPDRAEERRMIECFDDDSVEGTSMFVDDEPERSLRGRERLIRPPREFIRKLVEMADGIGLGPLS